MCLSIPVRNLQVGYCIVEDVGQYPPTPVKDIHWDMGIPEELPHTMASWKFRGTMPPTSSHDVEVPLASQQIREPNTEDIPVCLISIQRSSNSNTG